MRRIVQRSVSDKKVELTFRQAPPNCCVAMDPVNTCPSLGDILYEVYSSFTRANPLDLYS